MHGFDYVASKLKMLSFSFFTLKNEVDQSEIA